MRLALVVLFFVAAVVPIGAQERPKSSVDVRREKMDKVNKVWDAQVERLRSAQIAAKCKVEAKKQYSAIHFKKRRLFVKNCIEQGRVVSTN